MSSLPQLQEVAGARDDAREQGAAVHATGNTIRYREVIVSQTALNLGVNLARKVTGMVEYWPKMKLKVQKSSKKKSLAVVLGLVEAGSVPN